MFCQDFKNLLLFLRAGTEFSQSETDGEYFGTNLLRVDLYAKLVKANLGQEVGRPCYRVGSSFQAGEEAWGRMRDSRPEGTVIGANLDLET